MLSLEEGGEWQRRPQHLECFISGFSLELPIIRAILPTELVTTREKAKYIALVSSLIL